MNHRTLIVVLLLAAACPDNPQLAPSDAGRDDVAAPDLGDAGDRTDSAGSDADIGTAATVGDDHFSVTWDPQRAELTLARDDTPLLRFASDGIQVGVVDPIDEEVNYDPYGFFNDAMTTPAPPLDAWHTVSRFVVTSSDGTHLEARLGFGDDIEADLVIDYGASGRFDATLTPVGDASTIAFFRLSPHIDPAEGLYGLGEFFDDVNQRGHVRAMQLELEQGVESAINEAHFPIPLLIGTTGWGLFVNDVHPGVFDVATTEDDRIHTVFATTSESPEGFEFHLFAADHPLDVTRHYYDLTGYPAKVARWALGPWIWRDENEDQAQVESDVNTIRDLDLATTGYWIDRPYATAVNTFDFDATMFDDPQAMIDTMHGLGFRVALWHTPYLDPGAPETAALRAVAEEEGYYPSRSGSGLAPWGRPLDLSNPAAAAWWQSNLQSYIDLGIEGFKLDYAEEVAIGVGRQRFRWEFYNGLDERTMHALYQQYYHGAYADLLAPTGGFLLCRHGTIGDQTRVGVVWPGDLDANMARHRETVDDGGDTYRAVGGLPASLVAALSLGPSGYPLFGSDTGGYRHSPPDKETFVRWFETTALSTVMQVGTSSNDVPWEFNAENGFDQESLDLYRIFARLHLRLFPYVWTYLQRLAEDGRPVQRALGLAYPELGVHPNDEFLLGDHLFVAPVVERGATTRTFTLPPGEWVDWWTGDRLSGGSHTVDAPLDTLPLYLAANGIVPLLRPTIDAMAPVDDPARVDSYATTPGRLHARVAAGAVGTFEVFDGSMLGAASDGGTWTLTSTTGAELADGVVWEIVGLEAPQTLELDGTALDEVTDIDASDRGFLVDGIFTYVLVGPGTHTVRIR